MSSVPLSKEEAGYLAASNVGQCLHLINVYDQTGRDLAETLNKLLEKSHLAEGLIAEARQNVDKVAEVISNVEIFCQDGCEHVAASNSYLKESYGILHKALDWFDWGIESVTGFKPISHLRNNSWSITNIEVQGVQDSIPNTAAATEGMKEASQNLNALEARVIGMRDDIMKVKSDIENYHKSRASWANGLAVLGALFNFGFAAYQLKTTSEKIDLHKNLAAKIRGDLDKWKADFNAFKDDFMLEIQEVTDAIGNVRAIKSDVEAANNFACWLLEYQKLQIKLQELQLQLKDIEIRIAKYQGEANGRKGTHLSGMVTSGINLGTTTASLVFTGTNPFILVAAGVHAGAALLHYVGKKKIERTIAEWEFLEAICKNNSTEIESSLKVCNAIVEVLSCPFEPRLSLRQQIAQSKKHQIS